MEFHFVGKTVMLTISHWDAQSRAHSAEGSGGGLYAVNVEVEEGEEGSLYGDEPLQVVQLEQPEERRPRPMKNVETASRRSSSRPNSIRSPILAVHRQLVGNSKGAMIMVLRVGRQRD